MDQLVQAQLTAEYGELYFVEIAGKEYAYRALTLEELETFAKLAESTADLEDIQVQNSVVFPLDFDLNKVKAGHISALAEAISNISGLNADFILNTLAEYRKLAVEDILVKMKAMIIAAMPNYTDEYINTLTIKQLIQKLVLSEEILTIKQVVNGIQSEGGVRLEIAPVGDETQEPAKKPQKVDKETLLQRIRKENQENVNPFTAQPDINYEKLNELDPDLLVKATGHIDKDDPIARKLRKSMGG